MCDADDFFAVKKEMVKQGLDIRSAELEYIPISKVEVSTADMERLLKMVHKLEDTEDIVNIVDNIA